MTTQHIDSRYWFIFRNSEPSFGSFCFSVISLYFSEDLVFAAKLKDLGRRGKKLLKILQLVCSLTGRVLYVKSCMRKPNIVYYFHTKLICVVKLVFKLYYRPEDEQLQRESTGTAGINRSQLLKLQLSIQNVVTVYNLKADHLNSDHFCQLKIVAQLQCCIAAEVT